MKSYRKTIENGFIRSVAFSEFGEEITEAEYNEILSLIRNTPTAPDGYCYMLRAADFEWVLVEITPEPPEPEPEPTAEDKAEAYDILMGVSE